MIKKSKINATAAKPLPLNKKLETVSSFLFNAKNGFCIETTINFLLKRGKKMEKMNREFFNGYGFVTMAKNQKIAKVFDFAENFDNGCKPLVKTELQSKGAFQVSICIDKNNVFAHVLEIETGKEFYRKAPTVKETEKQLRHVKALVGKLCRKTQLAKSNMLQTRVCNQVIKPKK